MAELVAVASAFIPRAFSITHISLTHRNWTAVGLPARPSLAVVDPRGLITPLHDGWSVDTWIFTEDGRRLLPSRVPEAQQQLDLGEDSMAVVTITAEQGMMLPTRVTVVSANSVPSCHIEVQASANVPSWVVLALRPYNVHGCRGMDSKLSPERIARVIAQYSSDIVALQELDAGRPRSGGIDQAHRIARILEMDFHFHPALHVEEERYGDAILTWLPLRLVKAGPLPNLPRWPRLEPRGALWVAIDLGQQGELQVINTHLGLFAKERRAQIAALVGDKWLAHPDCSLPVILCGDLNALPSSQVCRMLHGRLRDAQNVLARHSPRKTFSGRFPAVRIDHVFVGEKLDVTNVEVPSTNLTRVPSDHLPLIVDGKLTGIAADPIGKPIYQNSTRSNTYEQSTQPRIDPRRGADLCFGGRCR